MSHENSVKVWDLFIRIFHWSLVVSFFIAYISDEESLWHIYAGYTVLALITLRVLWGIAGSQYARFSNFIYSPKNILQYLKALVRGKPKRYLGHNPAGGLMVIMLLLSLFVVTVSGLKIYAIEEGKGPLSGNSISIIGSAYAHDDDHKRGHDDDDRECGYGGDHECDDERDDDDDHKRDHDDERDDDDDYKRGHDDERDDDDDYKRDHDDERDDDDDYKRGHDDERDDDDDYKRGHDDERDDDDDYKRGHDDERDDDDDHKRGHDDERDDDDDHKRGHDDERDDDHKRGHDGDEDFWEEIHETSANFTLFLIFLHIAGVVVSGKLHNENLVKSMITGDKKPEQIIADD